MARRAPPGRARLIHRFHAQGHGRNAGLHVDFVEIVAVRRVRNARLFPLRFLCGGGAVFCRVVVVVGGARIFVLVGVLNVAIDCCTKSFSSLFIFMPCQTQCTELTWTQQVLVSWQAK